MVDNALVIILVLQAFISYGIRHYDIIPSGKILFTTLVVYKKNTALYSFRYPLGMCPNSNNIVPRSSIMVRTLCKISIGSIFWHLCLLDIVSRIFCKLYFIEWRWPAVSCCFILNRQIYYCTIFSFIYGLNIVLIFELNLYL